MLSLDKALWIYQEKLNKGECIDLNYFKQELNEKDYSEFLDLIKYVKISKSLQISDDFEKRFKKLIKLRNEKYPKDLKEASGFRTENGECDEEAKEILDKLFEDEFKDD